MMWSVQGKPLKMSAGAGRMVEDTASEPKVDDKSSKDGVQQEYHKGGYEQFSGKGINGKVTSARPITNLEDATNLHIALVDIHR